MIQTSTHRVYGTANLSRVHYHAYLYIHRLLLTQVLFHQALQTLTPLLLRLLLAASNTVICHPRSALDQHLPLVWWRCLKHQWDDLGWACSPRLGHVYGRGRECT